MKVILFNASAVIAFAVTGGAIADNGTKSIVRCLASSDFFNNIRR